MGTLEPGLSEWLAALDRRAVGNGIRAAVNGLSDYRTYEQLAAFIVPIEDNATDMLRVAPPVPDAVALSWLAVLLSWADGASRWDDDAADGPLRDTTVTQDVEN